MSGHSSRTSSQPSASRRPAPTTSCSGPSGPLRTMGDEHRRRVPPEAPAGFIPARLRSTVVRSDGVDRRAWELCLL